MRHRHMGCDCAPSHQPLARPPQAQRCLHAMSECACPPRPRPAAVIVSPAASPHTKQPFGRAQPPRGGAFVIVGTAISPLADVAGAIRVFFAAPGCSCVSAHPRALAGVVSLGSSIRGGLRPVPDPYRHKRLGNPDTGAGPRPRRPSAHVPAHPSTSGKAERPPDCSGASPTSTSTQPTTTTSLQWGPSSSEYKRVSSVRSSAWSGRFGPCADRSRESPRRRLSGAKSAPSACSQSCSQARRLSPTTSDSHRLSTESPDSGRQRVTELLGANNS